MLLHRLIAMTMHWALSKGLAFQTRNEMQSGLLERSHMHRTNYSNDSTVNSTAERLKALAKDVTEKMQLKQTNSGKGLSLKADSLNEENKKSLIINDTTGISTPSENTVHSNHTLERTNSRRKDVPIDKTDEFQETFDLDTISSKDFEHYNINSSTISSPDKQTSTMNVSEVLHKISKRSTASCFTSERSTCPWTYDDNNAAVCARAVPVGCDPAHCLLRCGRLYYGSRPIACVSVRPCIIQAPGGQTNSLCH